MDEKDEDTMCLLLLQLCTSRSRDTSQLSVKPDEHRYPGRPVSLSLSLSLSPLLSSFLFSSKDTVSDLAHLAIRRGFPALDCLCQLASGGKTDTLVLVFSYG
jgi:hypothetical protein